jgi:hypothetical protein
MMCIVAAGMTLLLLRPLRGAPAQPVPLRADP